MTHQRVENFPRCSSIDVYFLTRGIKEETSTIFAAFFRKRVKNQKLEEVDQTYLHDGLR